MVERQNPNDAIAELVAWLEGHSDVEPVPVPNVNTGPLQVRIPVTRPQLTQVAVDRWM